MSRRDRKIQTEILSKISLKASELAYCAKKSDLFKKFKRDRIRVVMYLSINSEAQVEKFKLDDKPYPEDFANCAFNIIDLIAYPRVKSHELIEVEQPFIFSKKQ